jgi:hypothetical protein
MKVKNAGDRIARFYYKGKLIVYTGRSMGSKKLDGNIPHLIRQQMKLNEAQFKDLIDCPLGYDEYVQILKDKGLIEN